MSDPKPYTMNECPVWHGTVASVHLGRVRATVEALEQERVEYAAEAQRHDETKAALLEAQRERDALVRERDEARADAALLRIALENAEPIEAERDALKAALREMVERGEGCPACGDGTQGGCGCCYERAREALGEVE